MPCIPHRPGRPYEGRPSQSKRTLADALNLLHGMRHEQNRHVTALDKVLNTGLALLLEEHVADGKHLIDDQDIGLGNGGDCKSNARNHTRREVLERHVDKVLQLNELDNAIKVGIDKFLGLAD